MLSLRRRGTEIHRAAFTVVGLTGGIATGKSTVSALLKAHAVPVVDADVLAREVVQPGTRGHARIVAAFGHDILLPNGALDRPKLGALVFGDADKRKTLNAIVHPAVRWAMVWHVVRLWVRGEKVCVLDVPLLIEAGLWKWVGMVVVVYCSEELQLKRLMARDKSTEDAAMARIQSQMSISEKTKFADEVIDNSGELAEIEEKVTLLLRKLNAHVKWTWRLEWLIPPFGLLAASWTLLSRSMQRSFKPVPNGMGKEK